MACLHEFTLAVYADGELTESETGQVRDHLMECDACRELAASLQEENRSLVHAFQMIDVVEDGLQPAISARPDVRLHAVQVLGAVFGAALAIRIGIDSVAGVEPPAALAWLNPFNVAGQLNLLLSSLFFVVMDGASAVVSLVYGATLAALYVLIFAGATWVFRRKARAGAMLGAIVLPAALSHPVYALDIRHSQNVTITANDVVNDTLVAFGESVIVDGTINGDLVTFSKRVVVNGTVKGNVISCGQSVEVVGTVTGDVLGCGQSVQVRGSLDQNLFAAAQTLSVARGSEVRGNATLFSSEANIDGNVGKDVFSFAGRLDVNGNVSNNVSAYVRHLTLQPPAHIGGNLEVRVARSEDVNIEQGAIVDGQTKITSAGPQPSKYATASFYIRQIIWLGAAFVTGFALFWLLPFLRRATLDNGVELVRAAGIGFLSAVTTPIAAILAAITLIGLPLGLATLAVWGLGLYLAKIVVAVFLGRTLLREDVQTGSSLAVVLFLGLVIVDVAVNLPYVGAVINVLLTLIGLGMLLLTYYRHRGPRTASPAQSWEFS